MASNAMVAVTDARRTSEETDDTMCTGGCRRDIDATTSEVVERFRGGGESRRSRSRVTRLHAAQHEHHPLPPSISSSRLTVPPRPPPGYSPGGPFAPLRPVPACFDLAPPAPEGGSLVYSDGVSMICAADEHFRERQGSTAT